MKSPILYCFYFLLLMPVVSETYATELDISEEFLIASDVTLAKAAVANNGSNYLVVSCRHGDIKDNLIGILVSTEGAILSSFPIVNFNSAYGCDNQYPAVAFDGNNYLVVFRRTLGTGHSDMVGIRVTQSGNVLDGPDGFIIISETPYSAAVAFDGNNYLVVTDKFNDETFVDIHGARVTPAGVVLDEFQITYAPNAQGSPSIAFDGTNYLVVWVDARNDEQYGDIYGARISPEGSVLDPEGFPIANAYGAQYNQELTFDGNNYFAVWEDSRNDPDIFPPLRDIYGTRITPNGVLLDGPSDSGGIVINNHPRPKFYPDVSFDGKDLFVSWQMSFFNDPPAGIFAARVSTEGILIDGPNDAEGILISEPKTDTSNLLWPVSSYNGKNMLLGWIYNEGLAGITDDIRGVLIPPVEIFPWEIFIPAILHGAKQE